MRNFNILTHGRLSHEFQDFIAKNHPEIECVVIDDRKEAEKEIVNFNAVAGFNFLEGMAVGHLEWIHAFGAGVDSFVKLEGLPDALKLTRTPGQIGLKIGEFCLAYVLNDLKSVWPTRKEQERTNWQQQPQKYLFEQRILVLGTGTIGAGIGQVFLPVAREVYGVNTRRKYVDGFTSVMSLSQVLTSDKLDFDIVINALPLTENTKGMIDQTFFTKLDQALFINVGRGATVVEDDLIRGLDNGNLRGAILDVFEEEPLISTSDLWSNEKVVVTPHQSGLTTIDEVIESFNAVYHQIRRGGTNNYFVDRIRGY